MMKTEKRGKIRIMYEILKVIRKEPARKTKIVYTCNLNFRMLKEYMDNMEENKLLINNKGYSAKIEITEKGKKYMKNYDILNEGIIKT